MSKYWANGSTRSWRKIRLRVLQRDAYICQLQIVDVCKYRADCVHHTKGKQFGDDMQYLVSACTPCNLRIGEPNAHNEGAIGGAISNVDPQSLPSTLL